MKRAVSILVFCAVLCASAPVFATSKESQMHYQLALLQPPRTPGIFEQIERLLLRMEDCAKKMMEVL